MTSSLRVQNGSKTRGSTAINLGEEANFLSSEDFRQGSNIRTVGEGFNSLSHKIRNNSDMVRTVDGQKLDKYIFDDSLAYLKSDLISEVEGRFSQVITHEAEHRDLGQPDLFNDGTIFHETTNPDDPLTIIGMLDTAKELPFYLVDDTSQAAFDGKLDPLGVLRSTDRGGIDHPFQATGIKVSSGNGQDAFLKSFHVQDRFMIPKKNEATVEFYLDAPEVFGNTVLPAVINVNVTKITPFDDIDPQEKFVNENIQDADMRQALKSNNFDVGDDLEGFDKMSSGGKDYFTGPDSLVYGGLKR